MNMGTGVKKSARRPTFRPTSQLRSDNHQCYTADPNFTTNPNSTTLLINRNPRLKDIPFGVSLISLPI